MKTNEPMVEVARSFSYKHNLGNYQSADFFCSQKAECPASEASEMSEKLYQFCKAEVARALNEYKAELNPPEVQYTGVVRQTGSVLDGTAKYTEVPPKRKDWGKFNEWKGMQHKNSEKLAGLGGGAVLDGEMESYNATFNKGSEEALKARNS